jgi:hypothetical protein
MVPVTGWLFGVTNALLGKSMAVPFAVVKRNAADASAVPVCTGAVFFSKNCWSEASFPKSALDRLSSFWQANTRTASVERKSKRFILVFYYHVLEKFGKGWVTIIIITEADPLEVST